MALQSVFTKLVLIVVLGAVLRLWGLTQYPPALNWDEISHGYTAYSLFQTGQDQWKQTLPIFNFRGYGDYPTTLTAYLTVPWVAVLGPTDWALRLPQAIMGILTIIAGFEAGYGWKKSWKVGLFTALLLAVEPWTLFPSRAVFQSNSTVLLMTLFLAAYFRKKINISAVLLIVSLFSYHNARILSPVLATLSFVATRNKIFLIVIGLAAAILLSPASRARSSWVGIIDAGAISYLEEQRNLGGSKFIYNRPVFAASKIIGNYLGYFSPKYLFFDGGTQSQFSLLNWGVSHEINLAFFYLGLILLPFVSPFLFIYLAVSALPAAVTVDQFAVIRATTMLPLVPMLTAFGLVWVLQKIPSRLRLAASSLYVIVLLTMSGLYFRDIVVSYSRKYSQSWQYGYKQVVQYIKQNYSDYDQIVVTKKYGEPHQFILWYWPWEAKNYTPEWDYHDNWYWVNGFDKFVFVNDWEMKQDFPNKTLIVASPDNVPEGDTLKTIDFLNGKQAFVILEK